MVGGEDQNVVLANQLHQLRQTAIKQLQTRRVAGDIATVAPGGVKVDEVSEDDGLVARFLHLFDGRVEQRVQPGGFHFLSDAAVGVDVGDFTHGHHVAVLLVNQLLQHGRRRRFDRQIVTVAGTLEVTGFVADKRTGDDAANVIAAFGQLFTRDFAQLIQLVEAKGLFVTGDLEHRVSGGIEDRFPGFHMLFAELIEDHRPGGVAVAEIARQVGAFHQLIQQLLREAVFLVAEVAPVKQHRHAGDFPVAGRGIFTGRKFMRPGIGANHFGIAIHTSGNFTGGAFMRFHQTQTGQVR